ARPRPRGRTTSSWIPPGSWHANDYGEAGRGHNARIPGGFPHRACPVEEVPEPGPAVRPPRLPAAPGAPDFGRRVRGRLPRAGPDAGAVRRAHGPAVASRPGPVQPGARARLRQGDGVARAAWLAGARPGDEGAGGAKPAQR